MNLEVVVIDVTEMEIERPKKNNDGTIAASKNVIPSNLNGWSMHQLSKFWRQRLGMDDAMVFACIRKPELKFILAFDCWLIEAIRGLRNTTSTVQSCIANPHALS